MVERIVRKHDSWRTAAWCDGCPDHEECIQAILDNDVARVKRRICRAFYPPAVEVDTIDNLPPEALE